MHVSDRLIYILLILVSLTLLGMLIGSWRIILYPHLFVVGLSVLIGMWRRTPQRIVIPVSVTALFLVLYVSVDIIWSTTDLGLINLILGMTPPMAIYMLGLLPATVIACLLYALTFPKEEQMEKPNIKETVK